MIYLNGILLACIVVSWFCLGLGYITFGLTPIIDRALYVVGIFTYLSLCYLYVFVLGGIHENSRV
jgi:hypothetical protein